MKKFVIVVPSYNNKDWYQKNLLSIFSQKYSDYRVIYTDDCSPDGTGNLVEKFIKQYKQEGRVKLIKNTERKGAMRNLYDMIHSCSDDEVIVNCDGDDWYAHSNVLSKLDQVYSNPNIWMTYGQYRSYPDNRIGCSIQVPPQVIKASSYRQYRWCTSHLRTFYTWLFKKINKEDFIGENGKFYAMGWDLIFMFAMLEMSGQRAKFISDVLYIYNTATPINDSKVNLKLQQDTEKIIRNKKRYDLLLKAG